MRNNLHFARIDGLADAGGSRRGRLEEICRSIKMEEARPSKARS